MLTKSPEDAPDKPADVTIGFENGHAGFGQREAQTDRRSRCSKS